VSSQRVDGLFSRPYAALRKRTAILGLSHIHKPLNTTKGIAIQRQNHIARGIPATGP
jgi:hypothetical protein